MKKLLFSIILVLSFVLSPLTWAGSSDPVIEGKSATDINIDGGAIDSTPIGSGTPQTGAFTTLGTTGDVTVGTGGDPADAGAFRLKNADKIVWEASPAGADIEGIAVDANEVVQIGAAGASGVTITPAVTLNAGTSVNEFSIDGTLAGDSDDAVPTEKAVKNYIDTRTEAALDIRDFIHDDGSGTNNVISTMAFIPKFKTSGWPQAALNGLEVGGFWIDVYKNSHPAATSTARGTAAPDTPGAMAATSRSGVTVWDDISWISARIAASNRTINGRSCHLITPFERFAVLSWIMKSGNWGNIRGNNNDGKDTRDADSWENYGIFDPLQAAYRTLAGSGPASWWSGGVIGQGIHGLVGASHEWEDLRLESGIFQPKAYLAGAATAADTYIDYDDNAGGDAADICQLTPGVYTITDAVNGNEDVTVTHVLITGRFTGRLILSAGLNTNHVDNDLIQLKTAVDLCQDDAGNWKVIGKLLEDATSKYMALPDHADVSTHAATLLDSWYAQDNADSRALERCGHWDYVTFARSGLVVGTHHLPTYTGYSVGFRAALSIGNL
jgi:hypothetical protein